MKIIGALVSLLLFFGPYVAYFAYASYVGPYDGSKNWSLQYDDCNIFFNKWCREMYELPQYGSSYRRQ